MQYIRAAILATLVIGVFATSPAADVIISEFVANNSGTVRDADGDSSDWIELFNATDASVNLAGWHLTDNPTNLARWAFPPTILEPRAFLIVFASGKDRVIPGQELHTDFQLDSAGEYLALVKPDGVTITSQFGTAESLFPPQFADVSYGTAQRVETRVLVSQGSAGTLLVPTTGNGGNALGATWLGGNEPFDDSVADGWLPVTNGLGFDQAPTAGKVIHVDIDGGSIYSGPGANGTSGFWNRGGVNTTNLKYSDNTFSTVAYRAENWDGGPFTTAWTTHNLLRDFLYDRNPNPIDARLRLLGLDDSRTYDLYLYGGCEGGIYRSGGKASRVTYQGVQPGGDADYGPSAALAVPNNSGLLAGLSPTNGQILVSFETNPDTATFTQLGDIVVDLAGFTLGESGASLAARTDIHAAMHAVNPSAFVRLPFAIMTGEIFDTLTLRLKYDDGFVAWLNGVEIVRRNAAVMPGELPAFNAAALTDRAASLAAVFEDINISAFLDLLHPGTNVLAIQGLNLSASDNDFLLVVELTARRTITEPAPRYFRQATPSALNSTESYAGLIAGVSVDPPRGFFDTGAEVRLACSTPDSVIYFTLDGSAPDPVNTNASVYTAPLAIAATTTLRARAFRPNFAPSAIATHTYLFLADVLRQPKSPPGFPTTWAPGVPADYEMDPEIVTNAAYSAEILADLKALPSISVVMNRDDLFGPSGIYSNPTQRDESWRRATSFEYLDPRSGAQIQIDCGISIQGAFNRTPDIAPKHSFHLYFNRAFGQAKLDFPIIPEAGITKFDHLILRANHADSWIYPFTTGFYGELPRRAQYVRDEWSRRTHLAMGRASAAGTYAHLYVNGLYWGLYNVTERLNADFAAAYLGGSSTNWDVITSGNIFEPGPRPRDGEMTAWNQMMSFANAGVISDEAWQAMQEILDAPAFCDYMLIYFYGGETDWPGQNWVAGRERRAGAKFHFFVWDTETMFYQLNENRTGVNNANTPGQLYTRLRDNAEFRLLFADRAHQHLFNDGILTPAAVLRQYTNIAEAVRAAVVPESARWGDYRREVDPHGQPGHQLYARNTHWIPELASLCSNWIPARTAILLNQLRAANLYPNVAAPEFLVDGARQHGGLVAPGALVSFLNTNTPSGTIYFTADGSDPRQPQRVLAATTLVTSNTSAWVLVPTNSLATDWTLPDFDHSAWRRGLATLGYERSTCCYRPLLGIDVAAEMYNRNRTACLRVPFVFADGALAGALKLRVKYDDGYVAWLNGVEIARRNAPAAPVWNSGATATRSDTAAVVFEEVDVSAFVSALRAGTNVLAIQGLNVALNDSDFLIIPELVAQEVAPELTPGSTAFTSPFGVERNTQVKARIKSGATWSALTEAWFTAQRPRDALRITEIMYHPSNPPAGSPFGDEDFEFIELKNIGPLCLDLAGVRFDQGITFAFDGGLPRLGPGACVLLVKNRAAFGTRYDTNGLFIGGQYPDNLSNAGEALRLVESDSAVIHSFTYRDAWLPLTDGAGYSLTIADAASDTNAWTNSASWKASAALHGSPGRDDDGSMPNANFDCDRDGLPDAWEFTFGTNPHSNDALADPDADGASNESEFMAGTNPRDAQSSLKLSVQLIGPRQVRLSIPTQAGRAYVIVHWGALANESWQTLTTLPPAATSGVAIVTDEIPPGVTTRFYRVSVP